MATSGSTDWKLNCQEIITLALQDIGALGVSESIPAYKLEIGKKHLNLMIKAWATKQIGLWLIDTKTITLVASKASYTLGVGGDVVMTRPLEILEARLHLSGGTEIPMEIVSRDVYMSLANKTSSGKPNQLYYDPQTTLGIMYIWPTADDITDDIRISYRVPAEDFDGNTDDADFPVEWQSALVNNLAKSLCKPFARPLTPQILGDAAESLFDAMSFDREPTSVFFGVSR